MSEDYNIFFSNKKALCVSVTEGGRKLMKDCLKVYQMPSSDIFLAKNFNDGKNILNDFHPQIIICEQDIGGNSKKTGLDLFKLHIESHSNRSEAFFCIILNDSSQDILAYVLDLNVELYIIKPLSLDILKEKIQASIKPKINPTQYFKLIEKAQSLYRKDCFDEAISELIKATEIEEEPILALDYLGKIYKRIDEIEEAMECYKRILKIDRDHYSSLKNLQEIYFSQDDYHNAYLVSNSLYNKYPINPNHVPQLIEMLMNLEKYKDIEKYYDAWNNCDIKAPIYKQLATALILCCQELIYEKKNEAAERLLDKAQSLVPEDMDMQINLVQKYLSVGAVLKSEKIIDNIALEFSTPKVRYFQLIVKDRLGKDSSSILKLGTEILKSGYKNYQVYYIVIKHSIEIHRRNDLIDDLAIEAISNFPDKEEEIRALVSSKK